LTVKTKYGITELTIKKAASCQKERRCRQQAASCHAEDSIAEDSIIECSGRKRAKRKEEGGDKNDYDGL